MVEYLAGGRIQGVSALSSPPPATSWKELDRVTLTSAGDTIDTGTFTAKDNMMIMYHIIKSGDARVDKIRFNNDSGSNYASRQSDGGGSDSTATSQTGVLDTTSSTGDEFTVGDFANISGQEKLVVSHLVNQNNTGAGNAPRRLENFYKWANTSAQVNQVQLINEQSGSFDSGSEIVVLGYDNDEADSGTSVWEELANVDLSGGTGNSLSSGTISAKKYLWVQAYLEQSGSGDTGNICRFNSDSGSNYTVRYSENGGSDTTSTSRSNIVTGANSGTNGAGEAFFINMFIINKSNKEKLIIGKLVDTDAGAGDGTAPGKSEFVGKWDNTSDSITNITWTNLGGSATWATTSYLKVWGFD